PIIAQPTLPVPMTITPPSSPAWAPIQAACASLMIRVWRNGRCRERAAANSRGSVAPASARQALVRARAFSLSPASARHCRAASITDAKAVSSPRRRLAGPVVPSPRICPDQSTSRGSMMEGQCAAVAAVHAARPALERAALTIEERLRAGGRLVYAGAGTSGRLAVQDGAELMPTFSWPAERLLLLMAGGDDALLRAVEGAEDTPDEAAAMIYQHRINAKDALIAVAASG